MACVTIVDDKTIRIRMELADAVEMVKEAAAKPQQYAHDIQTICDKMPLFDYTSFCFYAYDSAALFERQLGMNPRTYTSFSLDAPDSFFYALYGGMTVLLEETKRPMPAR